MIIKIKSNKKPTFRSLLKYMFNNKDRLKDATNRSITLIHNLKGAGIENWHKQLIQNEQFRKVKRSNSVYFTHEILSWHKEDSKHLTLDKMEAMTKEYISKRNHRGLYIATAHFDRGHYHVHILASGIEYRTGKSLRMSRTEFSGLKKGMQEYQLAKYPELKMSVIKEKAKGKSRISDNEYQYKLRTGREATKETISAILKTCYKKADSTEGFYSLIKEKGLETYNRARKVTGILYHNQKFRFSRLGFTEEMFRFLESANERGNQLLQLQDRDRVERKRNKLATRFEV